MLGLIDRMGAALLRWLPQPRQDNGYPRDTSELRVTKRPPPYAIVESDGGEPQLVARRPFRYMPPYSHPSFSAPYGVYYTRGSGYPSLTHYGQGMPALWPPDADDLPPGVVVGQEEER